MKNKRTLSLILVVILAFSLTVGALAAAVPASSDVKLNINGLDVSSKFDDSSLWISDTGSTMVGIRAFSDALGAEIVWDNATRTASITGLGKPTGVFSPVAEYEYLVGAAAWQMSAESHALMMQAFNIAKENVDEMVAEANAAKDSKGYNWRTVSGEKQLFYADKRVAVMSDIDDTLVDGVHYTANVLGKAGEWTNKAFADFVMSDGCTALPGAVEFVDYCLDNGIEFYYVTNRYDQGYKTSQSQYGGQTGYKMADGTVVGSSTYEVVGKTFYDISMASMQKLGFATDEKGTANYNANAHLMVNDNKLNGSTKEPIRQIITTGGTWNTGERAQESTAYPEKFELSAHHLAMIVGDDLNDISQIFSDSGVDAVTRVDIAIDNMDKWGAEWIVLPNAVYGSSVNYANSYGISELFNFFNYTNSSTAAWKIYD